MNGCVILIIYLLGKQLIMPRFSTYTAEYSTLETLPWYFWTDEERSYVIKQAYEKLYLTSE
jgi:hypothetical protein